VVQRGTPAYPINLSSQWGTPAFLVGRWLTPFPSLSQSKANPNLYASDYVKLYVDTIHPIVRSLDPHRPWVDSSPSNGAIPLGDTYVKRWGNAQVRQPTLPLLPASGSMSEPPIFSRKGDRHLA
jgi:hypothetical protein